MFRVASGASELSCYLTLRVQTQTAPPTDFRDIDVRLGQMAGYRFRVRMFGSRYCRQTLHLSGINKKVLLRKTTSTHHALQVAYLIPMQQRTSTTLWGVHQGSAGALPVSQVALPLPLSSEARQGQYHEYFQLHSNCEIL